MLARMRRNAGDASSLISPFGSTLRRIAAERIAKIAERRGARGRATEISRVSPFAKLLPQPPEGFQQRRRIQNSRGSSTMPGPSICASQLLRIGQPAKSQFAPGAQPFAALRESTRKPP